MGFGTSVLLDALGPDSFSAPQSLAIYREIRLFEISRAALFQQSTILASERWLAFDQRHRIARDGSPSLLEEAFDLFLRLVILHQKSVTLPFYISNLKPILISIRQGNRTTTVAKSRLPHSHNLRANPPFPPNLLHPPPTRHLPSNNPFNKYRHHLPPRHANLPLRPQRLPSHPGRNRQPLPARRTDPISHPKHHLRMWEGFGRRSGLCGLAFAAFAYCWESM